MLLDYQEKKTKSQTAVLSVIDSENGEEIGQIYWSKQNNQFAFELIADEIFTSELIELAEKVKELTKERMSQMTTNR